MPLEPFDKITTNIPMTKFEKKREQRREAAIKAAETWLILQKEKLKEYNRLVRVFKQQIAKGEIILKDLKSHGK